MNDVSEISGFTPGPWRYAETRRPPINRSLYKAKDIDANGNVFWGYHITGSENGGMILPTLAAVHNFPDNIEANARLIAAAPDMHAEIARLRREKAELAEALETSSSMMEALAAQLYSWEHEPSVNWRGQMKKNAALRSATEKGEPT
jgi:hypothetical protein